MANITRRSRVMCVTGNRTTAQVNAGSQILPPFGGAYIIVGGWMRALGGAAATVTSVNISDTTGTPVVGVAVARAALSQDAVVEFDAGTNVTRTTFGDDFVYGKGLQIIKSGSDMATATSIDFCVWYQKVSG